MDGIVLMPVLPYRSVPPVHVLAVLHTPSGSKKLEAGIIDGRSRPFTLPSRRSSYSSYVPVTSTALLIRLPTAYELARLILDLQIPHLDSILISSPFSSFSPSYPSSPPVSSVAPANARGPASSPAQRRSKPQSVWGSLLVLICSASPSPPLSTHSKSDRQTV